MSLLGCTLPQAQQLLFSDRSVKQNIMQWWKIDLALLFTFLPVCSTFSGIHLAIIICYGGATVFQTMMIESPLKQVQMRSNHFPIKPLRTALDKLVLTQRGCLECRLYSSIKKWEIFTSFLFFLINKKLTGLYSGISNKILLGDEGSEIRYKYVKFEGVCVISWYILSHLI